MAFQKALLDWFEKNQRKLPWRQNYLPYQVWISEIMLQQTQMETVVPYFERWMKVFPSIESLARSPESKVMKHWEGLGYYSRARNLHASAKQIVENHGGVFPEDHETILSLKGIGPYTAGAIASIAFNQQRPIVDGNVFRVLSRVYAIDKPIDVEKNRAPFWELQQSLIPKGKARNFNQALMELGALVCSPVSPNCPHCPVQKFCKAFQTGNPEAYPVRGKRKKTVKVHASALVLKKDGKYFLKKRPVGKIMGGLWEFPEWKLAQNKSLSFESIRRKTVSLAAEEFSSKKMMLEPLGTIRRNYTYFNETLSVFLADVSGSPEPLVSKSGWPDAWASRKEFGRFPFSSAHSKIAGLLKY